VSSSAGDPTVAAGIVSFVLAVASFWGGILVAFVVFGCLLANVRALDDEERWSPSTARSLAGFAHLGAAVLSPLLFVSVPLLAWYLYRSRDRLGGS
jgi:D-alanyl-lipoteichoic acid acyltransferase DltB (MBOAT superfamily)